jgi:hypothetical protein
MAARPKWSGAILVQCVMTSLERCGLKPPASVEGPGMVEPGMVPGLATWGENPSFLRELARMGPVRTTRCISTRSRRSVGIAEMSKRDALGSTGQPLVCGGRLRCAASGAADPPMARTSGQRTGNGAS